MFRGYDLIQKIFLGLYVLAILAFCFFYFNGYDSSISWGIIAKANSENLLIHSFQKGPFLLDFKGLIYKLSEIFSAGPIERHLAVDAIFIAIYFFGISAIIAVSSTLSRGAFIGISIVIVFFFFFLRMEEIGAFGFPASSKYATSILFLSYLIPAYIFQAFWRIPLVYRILILSGITFLLWLFIGIPSGLLVDHLITNGYFSFQVLALLFLILIAEENVFGILYLISRVKGSKNSERHLMIFGFCYLLLIGLYYADMADLVPLDVRFFDPFVLFVISSVIACWSFWYKESGFSKFIEPGNARVLFFSLGLITLSFLAHNMFRGNDPAYQNFLYFIIYTHLAFGTFFLAYIILNFINPLNKGLQVFKIVYHSQNFPYISARLAGFAAIAAFFFLAQKQPYFLMRSGHYNYLGVQAQTEGDQNLAVRYFEEARIFGRDNHFSNYQLGMHHLEKEEFQIANFRFQRATYRYPSPQAYINQSRTAEMMDENTEAIVALRSGLLDFPNNGYIKNNLGLLYTEIGSLDSARKYLANASSTGSWNEANHTNYLAVRDDADSTSLSEIYEIENLAVKSNVLSAALKNKVPASLPLDTITFNESELPLHKGTYLVNYSWTSDDPEENNFLLNAINVPMNEELFRSAKQAVAFRSYLMGNINQAFILMDDMIFQGSNLWKGVFYNQKGKMALEQHILPLARQCFEEAISYGNQEARINLVATLLELNEMEHLYQSLDQFAVIDSFFVSLKKDIQTMESGTDLSEEMTQSYVYYHYASLDKETIGQILKKADQLYIEGLWMKIYKEKLIEDPASSEDYVKLFNPYLNDEEWDLQLATLDLIQGKMPDSTTFKKLTELAEMNAFNVPLIIEVARRVSSEANMKAYDLLVKATDANPNHQELMKAYIEESVKQRLFNYAESGLDRLELLMNPTEFFVFKARIVDQIAELRQESFESFQ